MNTKSLSMPFLGLTLLWSLASTALFAQGLDADTDQSSRITTAEAAIATNFKLNGVLVSPSGRLALINNRIQREGDRVGDAEILAITEGAVQVLAGSTEFIIRVGSTVNSEQPSGSNRAPITLDASHGPVVNGETLSHIATRYLTAGITSNQMMIALFEANPEAFGGNINVLREGAILRIPDRYELRDQVPALATAAVQRHMDAWRSDDQPSTQLANVSDSNIYGPVASGETLSEITARVSRNGTTMNQMMIVLFEANPRAFGGNINVLLEGAVLKIPDLDRLQLPSAEAATAEVIRHMDSWRPDPGQQPQLANLDSREEEPSRMDGLPNLVAAGGI